MTPYQPDKMIQESERFRQAMLSLEIPVAQFLRTGIYSNSFSDPDAPKEIAESDSAVTDVQVRRICRHIAKDFKRPFIVMQSFVKRYEYPQVGGVYKRVEVEPRYGMTTIEIPKKKFLMPLVTPLMLASGGSSGRGTRMGPVHDLSKVTLWCFRITDELFWDEYKSTLDRPEMRAARRLPPL